MAHVIAIANIKGGVGKTTASVNLSGGLARLGEKVLLVDADPQKSSLTWRGMRPDVDKEFSVISMPSKILNKEIGKLIERSDFDYVVIDCPPGGQLEEQAITRSALMVAHLAIVPTQPSGVDFAASADMIPLLELAQQFNEDLQIRVLINRKPPKPAKLGERARAGAEASFNHPVFNTEITQKVAIAECTLTGQTIFDYAPRSDSAMEYEQLTQEVVLCLSQSPTLASGARHR